MDIEHRKFSSSVDFAADHLSSLTGTSFSVVRTYVDVMTWNRNQGRSYPKRVLRYVLRAQSEKGNAYIYRFCSGYLNNRQMLSYLSTMIDMINFGHIPVPNLQRKIRPGLQNLTPYDAIATAPTPRILLPDPPASEPEPTSSPPEPAATRARKPAWMRIRCYVAHNDHHVTRLDPDGSGYTECRRCGHEWSF